VPYPNDWNGSKIADPPTVPEFPISVHFGNLRQISELPERILAIKCLLILEPTKRKVSGGNLPFPSFLCTSGMQQDAVHAQQGVLTLSAYSVEKLCIWQ